MTIRAYLVAAALAAYAVSGAAHAQQADDATEVAALASLSVNAADAIAAAEAAGSGKVVELFLSASGAPHYAVTLMAADGTETNFVVDANTGAVVQVGEAWSDGDGDGETADDGPDGEGKDGESDDDGQHGEQ